MDVLPTADETKGKSGAYNQFTKAEKITFCPLKAGRKAISYLGLLHL